MLYPLEISLEIKSFTKRLPFTHHRCLRSDSKDPSTRRLVLLKTALTTPLIEIMVCKHIYIYGCLSGTQVDLISKWSITTARLHQCWNGEIRSLWSGMYTWEKRYSSCMQKLFETSQWIRGGFCHLFTWVKYTELSLSLLYSPSLFRLLEQLLPLWSLGAS